MPGSEDRFLRYNEENTIKHILAIEDHSRNLQEGYGPEHYACITKHALQIEEQCDEGISHAAVASPNKIKIFKDVRKKIILFRKKLRSNTNPEKAIKEIRAIRGVAERLDKGYDTSECLVCNPVDNLPSLKQLKSKPASNPAPITYIKGMETNNKTGVYMRGEEVIKTIAGNTLGKVVETYLPAVVPPGMLVPGLSNATLANLAYGLAIDLISITKPGMIPNQLELPLVASANFVIADVVGDLVLGMVAPPAPVAAAANAVAMAGVRTNGSLIYVD